MIIDMHSHFVPKSWPDLGARFGGDDWPGIRHTGPGKAMLTVGARDFRPVHAALWDADPRIEAMDRDGIDVQVLCATPFLFGYQRQPEHALGCAQLFNDAALEICAGGSASRNGRLRALCQVPLQDTDLACRELTRAMRSGHVGVQIGNHVGALSNWVRLQNEPDTLCYYMVADWHALTTDYQKPNEIESNIEEMVADWLAAGLDPSKSVIFRQSWVRAHAELAWQATEPK